MTEINTKPNTVIVSESYEAPSGVVQGERFRFTSSHALLLAIAIISLAFILFITIARSIQISVVTPSIEQPEKMLSHAAQLKIRSWVKLPIGNRVLVLPGKLPVSGGAVGFENIDQVLEVGPDRHQQFQVVLVPLPGSLQINLDPDVEAKVHLDGEVIGVLPGLIEGVRAGVHQIKVDAPLYRAEAVSVVVQGRLQTESIDIKLDPAWANVSLTSNPTGATILIDGEERSNTPSALKLEEGNHQISVALDKFKSFTQDITIVAQQDIDLGEIEMIPADGLLEVDTLPSEAAVLIDGEYIGVSPLKASLSPDLEHTLQIYKAGHRLSEHKVTLSPAESAQEKYKLAQDNVAVQFSIKPNDAELVIDGISRGRGSQTVNLNTLPHRVTVKKQGYVAYTNQIIPTRRSSQLVSVNLLTKEESFWANVQPNYSTKTGHRMKLFKQPGLVKLGSSRRETGRRSNEAVFTANLKKHFYVSLHEVNNKQFRSFRPGHNSGNYKRKSLDSNKHPVVNVSWQDAALYCNWLSDKEGLNPFYQTKSGYVSGNNANANGYRLLTEVEWAWLARNDGGKTLTYPWGDSRTPPSGAAIGNFADKKAVDLIAFTLADYDDAYVASSPVGRFPANHRGLFDMSGNVAEWTNDWYNANSEYVSSPPQGLTDPLGPEEGEFHVIRGASWARGHLPQLRLAYRDFGAKGVHDVGFRIARYVGPTK